MNRLIAATLLAAGLMFAGAAPVYAEPFDPEGSDPGGEPVLIDESPQPTVVPAERLAETGPDTAPLTIAALAALFVGGGIMVVTRASTAARAR
jgi:hypothetical protein